jgi:MurNAc alpha-1-phosphate uridylyltransferase
MHAMILAAGRGERLRPLTDAVPKPLLAVGGKPLIVWHIERLVAAGISNIVINHAWLGHRLEAALGDGRRYNAQLHYSRENPALEAAGGITQALPLLGKKPFLVMNGDIWCDWDPSHAYQHAQEIDGCTNMAWLLLVDNPTHHPQGDFFLQTNGTIAPLGECRLTFSGIGIYHPTLFDSIVPGTIAPLPPLLYKAIEHHRMRGAYYPGRWVDVGTSQRLKELDACLATMR